MKPQSERNELALYFDNGSEMLDLSDTARVGLNGCTLVRIETWNKAIVASFC
jgi:hypothetical protein